MKRLQFLMCFASVVIGIFAEYEIVITEGETAAEPPREADPASDTLIETVCDTAPAANCDNDRANFQTLCSNSLKGVVDGPRCFFPTPIASTWNSSFDECKKLGGELAHLHTSKEFKAVGDFMRTNKLPDSLWIALRRSHAGKADLKTSIDDTRTFWHTTQTTETDPKLTAGNSWIRTHQNDDTFDGNNICIRMSSNYQKISDQHCTNSKNKGVCVINNRAQSYERTSDKCLQEVAIVDKTATTFPDCAAECSKHQWCRSFNYYITKKCQLFPFVEKDTAKKAKIADCYHFSYVS